MGFDDEFKWCPKCERYVKYLQNSSMSYCAECGGEVNLFSEKDWEKFQTAISTESRWQKNRRSD